jgi:hypothetical protein
MNNTYIIEKLDRSIVSMRFKTTFKYNAEVHVPKNHIVIVLNKETKEKQRMFEGIHNIKALNKKIGFLQFGLKKQRIAYDIIAINTDFAFENLWGGRFLFEDKPTKAEISIGVNGKIQYKLTDFENLFDLMERDNLDKVDHQNINALYEKERKPMNNAIINYLTNWANQVDSIKDLNNRKADTEQSILKDLNKNKSNTFIEVEKLTISEYFSDEAEQNRQVKNESNTKKFVKDTVGEEKPEVIESSESEEPVDHSDLFEKEEV